MAEAADVNEGAGGAPSGRATPSARRAALDAFLAIGREGRSAAWRYLLGTLLIALGWFVAPVMMLIAIGRAVGPELIEAITTNSIAFLFYALFSAGCAALWLWLGVALLHGRRFNTLFGAERRLVRRELWIGVAAAAALSALGGAVNAYLGDMTFEWRGFIPYYAPLALAAAALVIVQASAEELVFRGYFAQAIGARLPYFIAWSALPAGVFALLHYDPIDGPLLSWAYVGSTFIFAVMMGVFVWRTGGLSAAIGFHVGNNLIALLVFEPPVGVDGLGPIVVRMAEPDAIWPLLLGEAIWTMVATALLAPFLRPERPAPAAAVVETGADAPAAE